MAKICTSCGTDVSQSKRVKDPRGNYYCQPCYNALRAQRAAVVPPAASAGGGVGLPLTDDLLSLADEVPSPIGAEPVPQSVCRNCRQALPPGAVLCTACGTHQVTGQKLATQTMAGPTIGGGAAAVGGGGGGGVTNWLTSPLLWVGVALVVLLGAGLVVPVIGKPIGFLLLIAGGLTAVVGGYWTQWTAADGSLLLFLAMLFVPFVGLVMVIYRCAVSWSTMWRPLAVWASGVVLVIAAMVLLIASGTIEPGESPISHAPVAPAAQLVAFS